MDTVFGFLFGGLPFWAQILICVGVVATVFGVVRLYVGSWQIAFSIALAAGVAVWTALSRGRAYSSGRAAEQAANQKAADKRADVRQKRVDEIKALPPAKLKKRADRWVDPNAR